MVFIITWSPHELFGFPLLTLSILGICGINTHSRLIDFVPQLIHAYDTVIFLMNFLALLINLGSFYREFMEIVVCIRIHSVFLWHEESWVSHLLLFHDENLGCEKGNES